MAAARMGVRMQMNRRDAVLAAGALALSAAAGAARATPTPGAPGVSAAARALYARALVLDANMSPPLSDTLPLPKATLDMVRASGLSVVKTTLGGFNEDFEATLAEIALVQRIIELHGDVFLQVRRADDMARAKREGKMGIIFSFE